MISSLQLIHADPSIHFFSLKRIQLNNYELIGCTCTSKIYFPAENTSYDFPQSSVIQFILLVPRKITILSFSLDLIILSTFPTFSVYTISVYAIRLKRSVKSSHSNPLLLLRNTLPD